MNDLRSLFPIFSQSQPFVYLDSAATTHKPAFVIEVIDRFYAEQYGTVHRAVYSSTQIATELYQQTREKVVRFINAPSVNEVVFTRGTTDSINIIAESLALSPSSRILISEMEHHSNIVPWQIAAKRTGARLEVVRTTEEGELCLDHLSALLRQGNVVVVAITHCSNVLGTINPIEKIASMLDENTLFLVDGAQSTPHMDIDVQKLGCDFFCFSAHKMYGPTGVGVLWGREKILNTLSPARGGSDMIEIVSFEKTTYAPCPLRFEPGTPMIAQVIGFGAAIDFLSTLPDRKKREEQLYHYLQHKLQEIPNIRLLGTAKDHAPLQSFILKGCHPLDIATLLDLQGIAVRSGHLCCQPLLQRHGLTSALRVSLGLYNTMEDIDRFIEVLCTVCNQLG